MTNEVKARKPQAPHPEIESAVLQEITDERKWALEHRGGPMGSVIEWVSLIAEELGEAASEANCIHFTPGSAPLCRDRLERELIQIAQLAVSAVVWMRSEDVEASDDE